MKSKHMLVLLLVAILMPWAANAQNSFSYQEDFEECLDDALPNGWTKVTTGSSAYVYPQNGQVYNGSKSFGFFRATSVNNGYHNIVALPFFEVEPGSVTLSFWSKAEKDNTYCGNFDVGYITDIADASSFVSLYTFNYTNHIAYTHVENLQLQTMPENARIAFRHRPTFINYKWFIDDLTVTAQVLCCPPPVVNTPILTVGDGTVASLSWIEQGSASSWILQYGTDPNFTSGSYATMGQGFDVNGNTITANLSGLIPEQVYYARVRSFCDGCGEGSQWKYFSSFKPTQAVEFTPENSGSGSAGIPFPFNYCDIGYRSQFIIPANKLTQMTDGEITKMILYSSSTPTISFENAAFRIYMKEVEYATFDDNTFEDWDSLTEVFSGNLSNQGNIWTFEFDETQHYTYHGGNLLIAFRQYQYVTHIQQFNWQGAYQSGNTALYQKANAAHQYIGNEGTIQKFLPKTTFSYLAAVYPGPRSLTFTNPVTDGITATWQAPNANVTQYKYQYSADNGETWSALTSTTATSVTLTNLPFPDHTYLFRVKAYYGVNESNFAVRSFITEALCPIPSGVVVTNITAHTATFSWNVVEGAAYQCAVAEEDETFNWGNVPAGNTFTGLLAETDYVFHLRRNCTSSQHGYSEETTYSFQTTEACPAPTSVQVTYNGGPTALVTWNGNADAYVLIVNGQELSGPQIVSPYTLNVAYATTYTIGVKADCGSEGISTITYANSFDTDLCAPENRCALHYTLTDAYGNGWGNNTPNSSFLPHVNLVDVESGTLIESLTMIAGSSLSGTVDVCNGSTIDIVWDTAYTNLYSSQECGYIFELNGEVICQRQGCISIDVCDPPQQGLIARFTVNCGFSPCFTPTNFQTTNVSQTSATIHWTDNGEATSWKVRYKKASDTNYSSPVTVHNTTYTFNNLDSGTTYDVLIISGCDENKTLTGSFTTDANIICATPQNFQAVASTNSATISWTDNGDATSWKVRYKKHSEQNYSTPVTVSTTTYTISNLDSGTTYDVLIISGCDENKTLTGSFTTDIDFICATPQNFQAVASTNSATISWTDNGDATSWKVRYKKHSDQNYSTPVTVSTTTYTISNLDSGTTYDVLIISGCDENKTLTGSFTTDINCTTPNNFQAEANTNSATIYWTDNGDATSWKVRIKKVSDSNYSSPVTVHNTTFTFHNLDSGTTYDVLIISGCDETKTLAGSFTTESNCATPNNFQADASANSATIYWTDNGDATSWKVRIKKASDSNYSTPVTVHNTTFTFHNLDSGTTFDVIIISGCDENKTLTGSFTTDCETTDLSLNNSFTEGFENWTTGTYTHTSVNGVYPDCWLSYSEGTTYPHIINSGSHCHTHGGTNAMYFMGEIGTNSYLALPSFSNDPSTLVVSFWMQCDHGHYGNLSLGYITEDDVNFNTFQEIESYNNSTNMVQYNTYLGTYSIPQDAIRLAFRWYNGSNYNCGVCIDDVAVHVINKVFTGTHSAKWNLGVNWSPAGVPTIEDNVYLQANAIITGKGRARLIVIANGKNLTIAADGGTLKTDNDVYARVKKNIHGFGSSNIHTNKGYYLIASPIAETVYHHESTLMPNIATTGMIRGHFDLFSWDYTAGNNLAWRNYEEDVFNLSNGLGYLYANYSNRQLTFEGTVKANNIDEVVTPQYSDTQYEFNGLNLLGNPFVCESYITDAIGDMYFFRMNKRGNGFVAVSGPIQPMEGIFVQATSSGQSFKFTRVAPTTSNGHLHIDLSQGVTSRDEIASTDNAVIRFGEGNTLEKFILFGDNSRVYIPQEGKNYAVVNAGAVGELPLNFEAESNGHYTLDFTHNDMDFSYLHLIDRMTGKDINLLLNPSYSFDAQITDYASRFLIVFATGSSVDGDSFCFFNSNGNLTLFGIDGEAILQVIDLNGRILSSETFNGSYEKKINAAAGVYIIRLINNNDVKVQKIVLH